MVIRGSCAQLKGSRKILGDPLRADGKFRHGYRKFKKKVMRDTHSDEILLEVWSDCGGEGGAQHASDAL